MEILYQVPSERLIEKVILEYWSEESQGEMHVLMRRKRFPNNKQGLACYLPRTVKKPVYLAQRGEGKGNKKWERGDNETRSQRALKILIKHVGF